MIATRHSRQPIGFSLIELLFVIAIIGILAALLLPALTQGQARAKRVQCISQLRQIGIAFQNFAHDHNGRFPMQVPAQAGGTLELAQAGYRLTGEFYFAFQHFQVLSADLVTPKALVCPADTRMAASNFASFKNENLSYFVGINAELGKPYSILSGDRNVTNDWLAPATLVRLGPNYALRWTHELHRFKGNLLFSDGHIEQLKSGNLAPTAGQLTQAAELVLPSVKSAVAGTTRGSIPASTPAKSSAAGTSPTTVGADNAAGRPSPNQTEKAGVEVVSEKRPRSVEPSFSPSAEPPRLKEKSAPSTNAPSKVVSAKPESSDAASPLSQWLARLGDHLVKGSMWALYLLLLLLAIAALVLRHKLKEKKKAQSRPIVPNR